MMIESMRTRNAYKILVENPVGRRPFEMPKRRWDGTNKMAFQKISSSTRNWINLANSCEHDNLPSGSRKGGEFLD
jgi:hypothetical protein